MTNCSLNYSFSGDEVKIKPDRLTIFWGNHPHKVTEVEGDGEITNIYIGLSQFLQLPLPTEFTDALLSGAVLSVENSNFIDKTIIDRWVEENKNNKSTSNNIILGEIEMRIRRMAIEPIDVLFEKTSDVNSIEASGKITAYTEIMMQFAAENYTTQISIQNVTDAAGISKSHAMTLFKKNTGVSIKEYLTQTRLSHACMLLAETDEKVINVAMDSGFGSLSSFYDAFGNIYRMSPVAYRNSTNSSIASG